MFFVTFMSFSSSANISLICTEGRSMLLFTEHSTLNSAEKDFLVSSISLNDKLMICQKQK